MVYPGTLNPQQSLALLPKCERSIRKNITFLHVSPTTNMLRYKLCQQMNKTDVSWVLGYTHTLVWQMSPVYQATLVHLHWMTYLYGKGKCWVQPHKYICTGWPICLTHTSTSVATDLRVWQMNLLCPATQVHMLSLTLVWLVWQMGHMYMVTQVHLYWLTCLFEKWVLCIHPHKYIN